MKKLALLLLLFSCAVFAQLPPATGTAKNGKYQMNIPDLGTKHDSVCVWNGTDKLIKYISRTNYLAGIGSNGINATLGFGDTATDKVMTINSSNFSTDHNYITIGADTEGAGFSTRSGSNQFSASAFSGLSWQNFSLSSVQYLKPSHLFGRTSFFYLPNFVTGELALREQTIPITGTVESDSFGDPVPVTGNIRFDSGGLGLISSNTTEGVDAAIGFSADGNPVISQSQDGFNTYANYETDHVVFGSTNPDYTGLIGSDDYSSVIGPLNFVQKNYVDDAVSAAGDASGDGIDIVAGVIDATALNADSLTVSGDIYAMTGSVNCGDINSTGDILTTGGIVGGSFLANGETASRVAIFDAGKQIVSADTATYPSLPELAYVKGLTSNAQTQITAKANDSAVVHNTGAETVAGVKTFSSTIVGSVNGNAGTATALQNSRTIGTLTGDATSAGSSFNGTANNTNAVVLATVNSNVGTFGSASKTTTQTVNAKGLTTAISEQNILISESQVSGLVADLAASGKLTITAVKTGTYAPASGELVPYNLTGGNGIETLPIAPADGTTIGAKITSLSGANTLTINAGGSDVFNVAGGSASATLSVLNQQVILQYKASVAIWYVIDSSISKTYIDAQDALKAPIASPTFTGTVTIPSGAILGTPTSVTLTNGTALPESGVTNLVSDLAAKEVALTFSTGLTRTTNTITNNLSTGVSGGQTMYGGTASGDGLTIEPTTNATKGVVKVTPLVAAATSGGFSVGTSNPNANKIPGDTDHIANIVNPGTGMQVLAISTYGSGGLAGENNVHFNRYRGTEAVPLAVLSGDTDFSFGGRMYDGTALGNSAVSFSSVATQNYTTTAHGMEMRWGTTPDNSVTRNHSMSLKGSGALYLSPNVSLTPYRTTTNFVIDGATSGYTGDFRMLLQSTTTNGAGIIYGNSTSQEAYTVRYGSSYSGNFSGTSVPFASTMTIQSGPSSNQPIVNNGGSIINIIGTTSTNSGTRQSTSSFKIGTLADAQTDGTSTLQVNGSFAVKYIATTATYSVLTTDYVVDATTGTFTETLPTAVACAGRMYTFKNSGTGTITVATTSSQTIDGITTKILNTQYTGFSVVSDGANWKIITTF